MCIIEKIENKYGERTDGRYPLRKGCVGNIYHLKIGECFVFEYLKNNKGSNKCGYLRTSTVKEYKKYEQYIIIHTINSVYTLIETCKDCKHYIGGGNFNLCCNLKYNLCYEDTPACNDFDTICDKQNG